MKIESKFSNADLRKGWPILDVPKDELHSRLDVFKRRSLLILYRLADCALGYTRTQTIRSVQSEFLESLTSAELASLGVVVEVMGQNFYNITRQAIIDSGLPAALSIQRPSPSESHNPQLPTAPIADLMNDNWVRECMCVFEDLVQRYGPYFAWAYLDGSPDRVRRPDLWARSMLQEGLDNMNAFELGYTMSYASLQSVVWKVFCKKESCSKAESWAMAKESVESEMETYKIDWRLGIVAKYTSRGSSSNES